MRQAAEGPTSSETRTADPIGDVKKSIKLLLAKAEAQIARMGPSATSRLLKLTIESHTRTVESWTARPPTDDQLQRTRRRVEQVLDMARAR